MVEMYCRNEETTFSYIGAISVVTSVHTDTAERNKVIITLNAARATLLLCHHLAIIGTGVDVKLFQITRIENLSTRELKSILGSRFNLLSRDSNKSLEDEC
jgi:hypothetical protein